MAAKKRRKKKAKEPVTLRAWSVTKSGDPFVAPELLPIRLSGEAFGHPGFVDGKTITTSGIVEAEGRRCTTESGSVYVLDGEPAADYLEWLKSHGRTYNPAQPIDVKVRPHA